MLRGPITRRTGIRRHRVPKSPGRPTAVAQSVGWSSVAEAAAAAAALVTRICNAAARKHDSAKTPIALPIH